MYAIDTYKDVDIEIKISKIRIQGLKDQLKIIESDLKGPADMQAMQYSDMPVGSKRDNFYIDSIIEKSRLEAKLEKEEIILKYNLKQQEDMNIQLNLLEGLQYKIFKARCIDRHSIIRTAEILGTSTRTVDRIMARIKSNKKK